ncbi:MAG TPA: DUF2461 domain-containing protein [Chitinophagales bacterium]|nr:DUF2461 domain-containing protein [Chitinophagales bacterium]
MASVVIKKETLRFLQSLSKNNNREWFAAHKNNYTTAHENMIAFAHALLLQMEKHDKIETPSGRQSLHRIYRDIRFSKDKTPYNTHWGGGFMRATKLLRGSYYFHIEPGRSFISGGFWGPNAEDMKRIREDIDTNHDAWRKLLNSKTLQQTFGVLNGAQLSSAPRGYAKDHPAIDLLRYKQFRLVHTFTDEDVLSPGFISMVNDTFKKMRPFLNHMSEVLTTDANGELLV